VKEETSRAGFDPVKASKKAGNGAIVVGADLGASMSRRSEDGFASGAIVARHA
jgi:hypothetical protein